MVDWQLSSFRLKIPVVRCDETALKKGVTVLFFRSVYTQTAVTCTRYVEINMPHTSLCRLCKAYIGPVAEEEDHTVFSGVLHYGGPCLWMCDCLSHGAVMYVRIYSLSSFQSS